MAMGQFFQCLELKIECSEQGIVRRENKTEEKSGKCTNQILYLKAKLYAMPCPARCCSCRLLVSTPAWAK